MKSKSPLSSDFIEPSGSAAIIFGSSATVFLILSYSTGRLLFSFLFAVFFLASILEIREMLYQRQGGRNAHSQQHSDQRYSALDNARTKKRGRSKLQMIIETIVCVSLGVVMLYVVTANDMGNSAYILGSALPLIMILLDYNAVHFTWKEIVWQKSRLVVYTLSLVLFCYHLLTFMNLISIERLIPDRIRVEVNLILGLAFAPLLLATMYLTVRDTWRRMYKRPL